MKKEQAFDVLDRDLDLKSSYLLQASAGTGKTFSIENIVLRLLLEEKIISLRQILVMTFTKKATAELSRRIREKILFAIDSLSKKESDVDFLQAIIEKGPGISKKASLKLQQALYDFDEAQIFTIHGFCHRSLEEHGKSLAKEALEEGQLLDLLKDFVLHALSFPKYSPQQFSRLLKEHRQDFNSLLRKVLKHSIGPKEIAVGKDYESLNTSLVYEILVLKEKYPVLLKCLLSDFLQLAPFFKGLSDRQGHVKRAMIEQVQVFLDCLDQKIPKSDFLDHFLEKSWEAFENISEDQQKKTKKELPKTSIGLCFFREVQKKILPILREGSDYLCLLARLAKDCKSFLQNLLMQRDLFSHDELLERMFRASLTSSFAKAVSEKYKAVIVDEFQDTDPLQWKILKKLFRESSEKKYLYLVGDPKQSIYGFRGADIYTYFEAGKELEKTATLSTNYRSQRPLLEALNALFSRAEGFISLPREKKILPYLTVQAAKEREELENEASIAVMLVEAKSSTQAKRWPSQKILEEYYFSFIAREIIALKTKKNIAFSKSAVLVRDRFEASSLKAYFDKLGIPSKSREAKLIVQTQAFEAFEDLIKACLEPSSQTNLVKVLSGAFLRWPLQKIALFSKEKKFSREIFSFFYSLREKLLEEDFASFYRFFSKARIDDDQSLLEKLLSREGGLEIFRDLENLVELLIERLEPRKTLSISRVLEDLKQSANSGQEGFCFESYQQSDAVEIMTIHISKGLEFDHVFALGLIRRFFSLKELTACFGNKGYFLKVCDKDSPEQVLHEEEINAEKLRQLYVALTRAKKKLYLPVLFDTRASQIEASALSAMELFLTTLGITSLKDAKERFPSISDGISLELLSPCSTLALRENKERVSLSKPQFFSLPGPDHFLQSFSSLLTRQKENSFFDKEEFSKFFEEEKQQGKIDVDRLSTHQLPAGAQTGDFFHNFFETFPFHRGSDYSKEKLIEAFRPSLTEDLEPFEEVIAEMILNTLQAKLKIGHHEFSLCDLKPGQYRSEVEFLYYEKEGKSFTKGFIDLFFEHEGLYYFIDWKSNRLGDDDQAYSFQKLRQCMHEQQYLLQESIYRKALSRLLKKRGGKKFGGSFYLFLRGLKKNSNEGIYTVSKGVSDF